MTAGGHAQARARLNSAVTTLCASARRSTCFRSRFGGAAGSARRSLIRGAQVAYLLSAST